MTLAPRIDRSRSTCVTATACVLRLDLHNEGIMFQVMARQASVRAVEQSMVIVIHGSSERNNRLPGARR